MAIETGTSTGMKDLLADLRTFLTANGWVSEEYNTDGDVDIPDELFLRGPGSTATENVHVNIETYAVDASGIYSWKIRGATSYESGSVIGNQPGTSLAVFLHTIDTSMDYWFYVSDRRFIVVLKATTQYYSMYGGFFLPFANPREYPYPLYIGATDYLARIVSVVLAGTRSFADPGVEATWIRDPGGLWKNVSNHKKAIAGADARLDHQDAETNGHYCTWPYNNLGEDAPNTGELGGIDFRPLPQESNSKFIVPIHFFPQHFQDSILGIMEDVYWIPGFGLLTESTFTIGDSLADETLTLTANAGNNETVTVGHERSATANFQAQTNVLDTETVVIDGKTYTFQTSLTNFDGNVHIGTDINDTLDNLEAAIELGAGSGTDYAADMTVHGTVTANRPGPGSIQVVAKTAGTGQNGDAVTDTWTDGHWQNATMLGGTDPKVYTFQTSLTDVDGNVLIGAAATDSIDNLVSAIVLGAGQGTLYANLTVVHPDVIAAPAAGDTMLATAKVFGADGNNIVCLETLTGSWGAAIFSGGAGTDTYRIFQNVNRITKNDFFVIREV